MRAFANLFLLVVALLFISCASKQFAFRKTYNVKKLAEQPLSTLAKPALHTCDSGIVVVTQAEINPVLADTLTERATLHEHIAAAKEQERITSAKRIHAPKPLINQVFRPSSETASAQGPAFIFPLILLLLVVLLLVLVSLFCCRTIPCFLLCIVPGNRAYCSVAVAANRNFIRLMMYIRVQNLTYESTTPGPVAAHSYYYILFV